MSETVAKALVTAIGSKVGQSLSKAVVNAILGAGEVSEAQLKAFWEHLDPADAVIQVIDGAIFGNVMEELVYDVVIPAALKAKWSGIAIARLALVIGEKSGSKGGNLKKTFSALVTNYTVNGKLCLPRNKVCFCKIAPSLQILPGSPTTCETLKAGKSPPMMSGTAMALAAAVIILAAR